ncbi:MAG: hypothetical protein KKD31_01520, partial [Bacteroidetes bacterium]|nr:hypothetical protein [Bacteroidota bacterium]
MNLETVLEIIGLSVYQFHQLRRKVVCTEYFLSSNRKVYICSIVDNYSRAVLALSASFTKTSAFVLENLKQVAREY